MNSTTNRRDLGFSRTTWWLAHAGEKAIAAIIGAATVTGAAVGVGIWAVAGGELISTVTGPAALAGVLAIVGVPVMATHATRQVDDARRYVPALRRW